ncbi:MAG: hypothetical protein KJ941_10975 [Bacteroidetes bacterium]|nr:hypothetical protein [Bacteroidota bacterium]
METLLLNLGWSYLLAKALPYLLMIVIGVFASWIWIRRCEWSSIKRWSMAFLLFVLPFSVYFVVNPIYEGDFSGKVFKINLKNSYTTELQKGLIVLAKVGCPYCLEVTSDLKMLKKRNPKLKIHFLVLNGQQEDLVFYKSALGESSEVISYTNSTLFESEVGVLFPTFLAVKDKVAIQYWTNNDFGAPAKDVLQDLMK